MHLGVPLKNNQYYQMNHTKESINLRQWSQPRPPINQIFQVALNLYHKICAQKTLYYFKPMLEDIYIHKTHLNIICIQRQESSTKIHSNQLKLDQQALYEYTINQTIAVVNIVASLIAGRVIKSSKYLLEKPNLEEQDRQLYLLFTDRNKGKLLRSQQFIKRLEQLISYYSPKKQTSSTKSSSEILIVNEMLYEINNKISIYSTLSNRTQKYQQFLQSLQNMDRQIPKNWKLINAIGVLNQLCDNLEEAENYYKEASSLQSNNFIILNNLASIYYLQNRKHQYSDTLEQMKKISDRKGIDERMFKQIVADALSENYLKKYHYKKLYSQTIFNPLRVRCKIKEAEIDYAVNPKQSLQKLFLVATEINKYAKTKKEYVSVQPITKTLNQIEQQQPFSETDEKEIRQLKQINSINILYLQAKSNKTAVKIQAIQDLIRLNPQSKWYLKAYADALLESKRYQNAKQNYILIKKDFSNDYDFNWNAGKCFFELQSLECFQYFKNCLIINPDKKMEIIKTILTIDEYFVSIKAYEQNMRKSNVLPSTDQNNAKSIVEQARNAYNLKK